MISILRKTAIEEMDPKVTNIVTIVVGLLLGLFILKVWKNIIVNAILIRIYTYAAYIFQKIDFLIICSYICLNCLIINNNKQKQHLLKKKEPASVKKPKPTPPAPGTVLFAAEEVASHNKDGDIWFIIENKVYNVSDCHHPGIVK